MNSEIREEIIIEIAHKTARDAYDVLISKTQIDRPVALLVAKWCGEELERIMSNKLEEHGFAIIPCRKAANG